MQKLGQHNTTVNIS